MTGGDSLPRGRPVRTPGLHVQSARLPPWPHPGTPSIDFRVSGERHVGRYRARPLADRLANVCAPDTWRSYARQRLTKRPPAVPAAGARDSASRAVRPSPVMRRTIVCAVCTGTVPMAGGATTPSQFLSATALPTKPSAPNRSQPVPNPAQLAQRKPDASADARAGQPRWPLQGCPRCVLAHVARPASRTAQS